MKSVLFFTTVMVSLLFFSCDFSISVAVRNFREPSRVDVSFKKMSDYMFDNDTLLFKRTGSSVTEKIIRRNSAPGSYSFTAPANSEVYLRPWLLNAQPIYEVKLIRSKDSFTTINLWDKKAFKKLKKQGVIETKGFVFTTSILINNK